MGLWGAAKAVGGAVTGAGEAIKKKAGEAKRTTRRWGRRAGGRVGGWVGQEEAGRKAGAIAGGTIAPALVGGYAGGAMGLAGPLTASPAIAAAPGIGGATTMVPFGGGMGAGTAVTGKVPGSGIITGPAKGLGGGPETPLRGRMEQAIGEYMARGPMGVSPEAGVIPERWTTEYGGLARAAAGRDIVSPIDVTMDPAQQAAAREQQQQLVQMLQQRAAGEGVSPAQMMMQRGLQQAAQMQTGMARGGPGATAALRRRAATGAIAGMQQDVLGQMGLLRAQEQAQAQEALGGLLGTMRGQDIGFAGQAADVGLRGAMATQTARLQQQGLNDAMAQFYMQQGFTQDQATQQAAEDIERLRAGAFGAAVGPTMAPEQMGFWKQAALGMIGAGGAGLTKAAFGA